MIVQEDVPYTKEEVKAMVKTIHDLREKLSLLGWHPASESPVIPKKKNWVSVVAIVDFGDNELKPRVAIYKDKGWSASTKGDIKWWCYPPKEEV